MALATTTDDYRQRMALCAYDGTPLAKIATVAFGDGGHEADNTPKAPDASRTALYNELLRKGLTQITLGAKSVACVGTLAKPELVGETISEAAVFDEVGNMLGFLNFSPKIKESDETYELDIVIRF